MALRLLVAAGELGQLLAGILDFALLMLAVYGMFAVLAFVLCAPVPVPDRAPSVSGFLAGTALGLVVAIIPLAINYTVIRGGTYVAGLSMLIGLLVAALNGE